ncbi:DNA helicase rad5 [Ceratobasidium sp. UAMH 11750]|nr:DNA helicase rad5 [Ceratobasidium sp. UAMH 11750]
MDTESPTNRLSATSKTTGETAVTEPAEDELFFDIPEEELAEFERKKAASTSTARPLFLPSSPESTTKLAYRDSASADVDWIPSEDERSFTRPSSPARTRSAPSSVITISDSEEEGNAGPPPPKKRKHTPVAVAPSLSTNAVAPPASSSSSLHKPLDSAALYVGDVVVEAWSLVKGKGYLRKGELLRLERDASASGATGKTSSKSSSNSLAALAEAAKKKAKEDAIVRVVNSQGAEVGRIVTAAARWIAKLLDKDLVHISGTPIDPPAEFKRIGDNFSITLKTYLKASAFRPLPLQSKPSNKALEKYLSATSKATVFSEGAETAEEQALRERKTSLVTLFNEVGLKPKRSGFGDFAKKRQGAKGKGKETRNTATVEENEDKATKKTGVSKKGKTTETIGEGEEAEEAEMEGQELNKNQLGDIYEKAQRDNKELAFMTPADSFALALRPYQQQALHWMWHLERGERSSRDTASLHPLWEEYTFPFEDDDGVIDLCAEERSFYFNPYSGELSLDFVKSENHRKGGILADGMSILVKHLMRASDLDLLVCFDF